MILDGASNQIRPEYEDVENNENNGQGNILVSNSSIKLKSLRNQKQKKNEVVRIKTNFNMRKVMENQQID